MTRQGAVGGWEVGGLEGGLEEGCEEGYGGGMVFGFRGWSELEG